MAKPKTQALAYGLMDAYSSLYELRFGKKTQLNRYREKWGFGDMIDSIGYDRAVEVIKFYFETQRDSYSTNNLFNTFDKLDEAIAQRDKDRERRAAIRKLTEQRVQEWDTQHESGSTGNQRGMRE